MVTGMGPGTILIDGLEPDGIDISKSQVCRKILQVSSIELANYSIQEENAKCGFYWMKLI
jgi:hypothetical protein